MEGKKIINIYTDYITLIQELNMEERGIVFTWVLEYCNDLNPEPPSDRLLRVVCNEIKTDLKRDLDRWKNKCAKNAENGALGGRPKKRTVTEKSERLFSKPKKADKDKDKDIDIDILVPVWDDFLNYCITHRPNVNKQDLKLKYESWVANGWQTGNDKKIKNWKTTALNTLPYLKEDEPKETKKIYY